MTDFLNHDAAGPFLDLPGNFLPDRAFGSLDADLDQLVVGDRLLDFGADGVRQAGIAYRDDGLQMVGEGAQLTALVGTDIHSAGSLQQTAVPAIGPAAGNLFGMDHVFTS